MIFDKLKRLIAEQFNIDEEEITLDTNFVDDLNADSIDMTELLMEAENEFDIEIPADDNDLMNLKTVGDVVSFISDRM